MDMDVGLGTRSVFGLFIVFVEAMYTSFFVDTLLPGLSFPPSFLFQLFSSFTL